MDISEFILAQGATIMTGILIKALKLIIKQISAPLKQSINEGLQTWKIAAAGTENPWDDLLVSLLISIFED